MTGQKRNYNPADYAALEQRAKAMNRKELEEAYVNKTDKSYTPCGFNVLIALLIILGVFLIFAFGMTVCSEKVNNDLSKNIEILEEDVCNLVGDYSIVIQERSDFKRLDKIKFRCVG